VARMVVIEHKDGRRVAVTPADFRRAKVGPDGETYEEQGFKIQHWEGGEPYEEPAPRKSAAADA
jgi:hypothetical protein